MMDEMANHATHVRKHIEKHGYDAVERWLDVCLSIEHLIDPHSMFLKRGPMDDSTQEPQARGAEVSKFKSKDYLDRWINPPEVLEAEAKKLREEKAKMRHATPARPTRDVLLYLLRARPPGRLAGGLPLDRARGELLLRPAGDDQGDERRLGQLLAQHADDQAFRRGHGDHRLRRPSQRHRPHAAGQFQSVQDRHRAVPRHRRPLEQGQVRQGIRGSRQPRREEDTGTRGWAWAARRSSKSGGSTTT